MELTLDEAALLTGRTVRQIRYLVEKGRIPARRDGARWLVDRADLPAPRPILTAASPATESPARALAEGPSLAELPAFTAGRRLYTQLLATLGEGHPGAGLLKRALVHLAAAHHRSHPVDKARALRACRDALSESVCELFLVDGNATQARAVERELLPVVLAALGEVERRGP
jgi:excisionase family DNA binding protein